MGGINHQPCRNYLPYSTKVSRSLSRARITFEEANISLEDLILLELEGKFASARELIAKLQEAGLHLSQISIDISELKAEMDRRGYVDLPPVVTGRISTHGIPLADAGAVSLVAWNAVWAIMRSHGFYAVLTHFSARQEILVRETRLLEKQISSIVNEEGSLNAVEILEENRAGNFRLKFAQLYNMWSEFQQEFLASAMISTETWYQHTRVGSLLPPAQVVRVA